MTGQQGVGLDELGTTEAPGDQGPDSRSQIYGGRRSRPRWRRRAVVTLTCLLVLVGSLSGWALWHLNDNITKVDVSAAMGTDRPAAGPTEAVNLLLIGSDTREGAGNDQYGKVLKDPGNHSDTNLLVHLSADRSWATVVSIPRDSMTPAPPNCSPTAPKDQWQSRQWNRNFATGGAGCLIRALEGNTGVYVDHYAVVDFRGFKTMVDALGGVTVCTSTAIDDSDAHLTLPSGRHELDGEQALGYVRTRKSIGDGSDLGRIERQQAFLSSVMQEATSTELLLQPTKLYSFLNAATSSLTTDPELGIGTMRDMAASVRGIGLDQIQFVTVPTEPYPADPNRVQWKASADEIWSALRDDRQIGAKRPSAAATAGAAPLTVSPAAISVDVRNATSTKGLARQAQAALTVQGFAEVTMSTATGVAPPAGALVEYSGADDEAARTVAAAFPGATVQKADGLGTRVRVTLGTDAPTVVEVPNRLGTEPVPSPSITPSPSSTEPITTRKADTDICA